MAFDWLDNLFTPCPLHLREMGYKRELFGIRKRWRQFGWAWEPHCERTRRLLLASMRRCTQTRKAVLFGTGFLHDVPLEEFSKTFAKVVLVDLLHPYSVRCKCKPFANVELLEADVSDTIEAVWQCVEHGGRPLPASRPTLFLGEEEVDFVASINLLSQLPCMPEQYAKRWKLHSGEQIAAYCRQTVEAHLAYLQMLSGVVTLIADVEMRTLEVGGRELSRSTTLYGARFPYRGERWVWPLVPGDRATHLIVTGIEDIKEQRPA